VDDARPRRIVVGMTGASGSILGVRLLEALGQIGVETHLVMTEWAKRTLRIETDRTEQDVAALATRAYRIENQAAAISSGSFRTDGMVIIPCSMNTVAALAHGLSQNLVTRAADVTLKERLPLVIVPRETPLSLIHLRNLVTLTEAGARVVPPMPGFYNRPTTVDEIVWHIVARVLDQLGLDNELTRRWGPAGATTGHGVDLNGLDDLTGSLAHLPAAGRIDERELP
jgi:4-hydroxy-3-polyprenylbenzoate decarboxylase